MSKLEDCFLGDLASIQTGPFGSQLHASDYIEEGIPVIMPTNIGTRLEINTSNIACISEKDANRLKRHWVKANDIVYSRRGDIEKCAFIKLPQTGWLCGTGCLLVRFNSDKIDQQFCAFYLSTDKIKSWISSNAVGATMPNLNSKILKKLPLSLPDLQTQSKIAAVLSALDVKIDLNKRINTELEALAKTLYDYWFVQFDFPDSKGKPYKSSGGKLVWNEVLKREIPEAWSVKKLRTEIEIQRGISYTSQEISNGEGIPMINLNSFNLDGTYKPNGLKPYSGKFFEKNIAKAGELLIAATDVTRNAEIIGKAVIIPSYYDADLVYSMDIAKVIPITGIPCSYLKFLFNSNHFHNFIKGYASGTLVLHLNVDGVKRYIAEIPPKHLLEKFDLLYKPISERISKTAIENQSLAALRDWLLPMLMNGQVQVK